MEQQAECVTRARNGTTRPPATGENTIAYVYMMAHTELLGGETTVQVCIVS